MALVDVTDLLSDQRHQGEPAVRLLADLTGPEPGDGGDRAPLGGGAGGLPEPATLGELVVVTSAEGVTDPRPA